MEDLSQISLAESLYALEKSDKKLEDLREEIDFTNMESNELRVFGKINDIMTNFE